MRQVTYSIVAQHRSIAMSEFLRNLSGQRQAGGTRSAPRPPLQANLCLQIVGWDAAAPKGGVVKGVVRTPDWLAGEEVALRLQSVEEGAETFRKGKTAAENLKFDKTRPSISKLMSGFKVGKNDIEPMQVGGLLMAFGAIKDVAASVDGGPVTWKAQYIRNYGNDSSRDVLYGLVKVHVDAGDANRRPRASLDLLSPRDSRLINSIDDFRKFYDECMVGQFDGVEHHANAAIRLIAPDGNQVKSLMTYSVYNKVSVPSKVEGDEPIEISVPATAEQTWKEAVEDGKQAKGMLKLIAAALSGDSSKLDPSQARMAQALKADLASGKLKIEAIPGRRLPIVGTSLDDVLDESNHLYKEARKCLVAQDGSDNKVPGFVRVSVGVMVSAPDGGNRPDSMIVTQFAADAFVKAR